MCVYVCVCVCVCMCVCVREREREVEKGSDHTAKNYITQSYKLRSHQYNTTMFGKIFKSFIVLWD